MGACFDMAVVKAKSTMEVQQAYDSIVSQRAWERGHGGYTGSFAENPGRVTVKPGLWSKDDAYQDCEEKHPKWDPAWAYQIGDDEWFVGAWCSS